MENRLDTLNQYKSEIFELKKKLAEKEAEYLDVGKEMFEQDTGWEFGKTVLTNKNGPVKLKILLNFAELRGGGGWFTTKTIASGTRTRANGSG